MTTSTRHCWHDLPAGRQPPEDVTVIVEIPAGSRIDVRPIGMLRMGDRAEPDNKILAVPGGDPHQLEYFDIADLPGHLMKEIEHFFSIYKDLEGARVEIAGWEKSEMAVQEIAASMTRYEQRYGRRRTRTSDLTDVNRAL